MVDVSAVQRLEPGTFRRFQKLMKDVAGIHISEVKQPLVAGRLAKRIAQLGLESYADYFTRLGQDPGEKQCAIDLLTTNETFFFREPKHFEFLAAEAAARWKQRPSLRVWCGASSTGEEPYTIAMVLAEALGHTRFEILASDISSRVLDTARRGLYPVEDAEPIPSALRRRHCLKGFGSQTGWFTLDPALKARVGFESINLNAPLPEIGTFDAIFLRNVMIYFSAETKRQVMARLVPLLRPGGYFFVSHSETLNGVTEALRMLRPSIYTTREPA